MIVFTQKAPLSYGRGFRGNEYRRLARARGGDGELLLGGAPLRRCPVSPARREFADDVGSGIRGNSNTGGGGSASGSQHSFRKRSRGRMARNAAGSRRRLAGARVARDYGGLKRMRVSRRGATPRWFER